MLVKIKTREGKDTVVQMAPMDYLNAVHTQHKKAGELTKEEFMKQPASNRTMHISHMHTLSKWKNPKISKEDIVEISKLHEDALKQEKKLSAQNAASKKAANAETQARA